MRQRNGQSRARMVAEDCAPSSYARHQDGGALARSHARAVPTSSPLAGKETRGIGPAMHEPLAETAARFREALESFVEKVRQDRYIIAAILFGSLSHDTVW